MPRNNTTLLYRYVAIVKSKINSFTKCKCFKTFGMANRWIELETKRKKENYDTEIKVCHFRRFKGICCHDHYSIGNNIHFEQVE